MSCDWKEGDRALFRYKNGKRVPVTVLNHHPVIDGWVNVVDKDGVMPVKVDWLERPRRKG